jgi:hypothetical protein
MTRKDEIAERIAYLHSYNYAGEIPTPQQLELFCKDHAAFATEFLTQLAEYEDIPEFNIYPLAIGPGFNCQAKTSNGIFFDLKISDNSHIVAYDKDGDREVLYITSCEDVASVAEWIRKCL